MNSSTLSAAATRLALRPIALLAVIVLSTLTAAADRFKYGDLWFETTSENTCEVARLSSSDLSEVTIPELAVFNGKFYNVTAIGNGAFYWCSSLTSIDIPNSVTTIGDWAFYECLSLTSITIPNSVTAIGNHAFDYCWSLTSINIPNSVTTIGEGAFVDCPSLTSITVDAANPSYSSTDGVLFNKDTTAIITHPAAKPNSSYDIPNSVITIGKYAFWGCKSLTSINIPNSVTTIGDRAFWGCSRLTSIDIPNSVTTIGDYTFYNCSRLTSIDIPNSVTTIGDGAFEDCSRLTSINIPNSVTTIGDRAFYGCSRLTSIAIPNSVTTIGDEAFCRCSSLTSINIPNSVTTIGDGAFFNCSRLTDVYNYALTPQVITENVFNNYGTLHVFTESKEAFENAAGWSNFYIVDDLGSCEGITPLTTDNDAITDVYSLDGRRTTSRQHNGISIVRTADGKTRKVMKN